MRSRRTTLGRFAMVGVVNTGIDLGLFLLLAGHLGIVGANFVSTSAGMTFSFVVNGLFTFKAGRLTWRHAALFLSTTGAVLWLLQPVVIHLLLGLADSADLDRDATSVLLVVKVVSIGISFVANFIAYRYVVWPNTDTDAASDDSTPA